MHMAQIGDLSKTDAKLLSIHSVATLGHLDQCFDKCMLVSSCHLLFDKSVCDTNFKHFQNEGKTFNVRVLDM